MATAKADLVLRRGKVFLGLGAGFTESTAIWGGRVIAHGSDSELEGLAGADTRVIELNGRLAVPGLNDAHQHQMMVGLGLTEVDCKTDTQLQAMLAKIKGTLKQGQIGDVTVFERDLFGVEPEEILEASADLAIVGGEIMFDRRAEAA